MRRCWRCRLKLWLMDSRWIERRFVRRFVGGEWGRWRIEWWGGFDVWLPLSRCLDGVPHRPPGAVGGPLVEDHSA